MILDFKRRNFRYENELPKTKIDERTGIEYHLEGRLLYTKPSNA